MRLIISISLVILFIYSTCAPENKKAKTPDDNHTTLNNTIPERSQKNSLANEETNICPDSAISYDAYRRYWSKDLEIERNILNEFDITNENLTKSLERSIDMQNKTLTLEVYELFTRKGDNEDILVKKGIARHVKGESPYDQEYYILRTDTLLGDSQSPTYYYYDDSLRVIESYFYDNVEGCTFSKKIKYFKDGKLSLLREYHFYENCSVMTKKDSLSGFIRDGNFRETFSFINNNHKDDFIRELNFYQCKESIHDTKYIVEKAYSILLGLEASTEDTNLIKFE